MSNDVCHRGDCLRLVCGELVEGRSTVLGLFVGWLLKCRYFLMHGYGKYGVHHINWKLGEHINNNNIY